MARILVDATGPPATRASAPAVRAVLASVWRPRDVLDVPAEADGAGALAAECWMAWAGTVTRPPLPADVDPAAAEAIRAAERLHGDDVRGVLLFTSGEGGRESMLSALASLAGVPVHTVTL